MNQSWTAVGNPVVNQMVSDSVEQISAAIRATVPMSCLRVAAIIGGYGRGEGGVLHEGGEVRPHNNLDLLIVSRNGHAAHGTKKALSERLSEIEGSLSVPVDVGWVSENRLRFARPRVMWYDVRFGHRVIVGDPHFLSHLRRFRADNIPANDVVDLLTNRAALLVIARTLIEAPEPSRYAFETAIKSTAKAVIGYGDALLWVAGQYDHSYRVKLARMKVADHVPAALRTIYAEAARFRFSANYDHYLGREGEWISHAQSAAEEGHRAFAEHLFGFSGWEHYGHELLLQCMLNRSARDWLAHLKEMVRSSPRRSNATSLFNRLSSERHRIAARLPSALYLPGSTTEERRNFVIDWARSSDINFPSKLRHELRLEETA